MSATNGGVVTARDGPGRDPAAYDRNEVCLTGRVSGAPQRRVLPSGDELVTLRLVVRSVRGRVDTVPIQVGPAPASGHRPAEGQVGRRRLQEAERLADGAGVEVVGSLQRRWWRGPTGAASTMTVTATTITPSDDGVPATR
jgi:single-strand DNA-binding protein